MPRILDNIDEHLLPALRDTLGVYVRVDSYVTCLNPRGRKPTDSSIEVYSWGVEP